MGPHPTNPTVVVQPDRNNGLTTQETVPQEKFLLRLAGRRANTRAVSWGNVDGLRKAHKQKKQSKESESLHRQRKEYDLKDGTAPYGLRYPSDPVIADAGAGTEKPQKPLMCRPELGALTGGGGLCEKHSRALCVQLLFWRVGEASRTWTLVGAGRTTQCTLGQPEMEQRWHLFAASTSDDDVGPKMHANQGKLGTRTPPHGGGRCGEPEPEPTKLARTPSFGGLSTSSASDRHPEGVLPCARQFTSRSDAWTTSRGQRFTCTDLPLARLRSLRANGAQVANKGNPPRNPATATRGERRPRITSATARTGFSASFGSLQPDRLLRK
ncbi:hypothetical protein BDV95DRAFT_599117 [Massariosphaeria phaeospora]|uniref:Uncharacterized protein n=1 Tax=Massariosphaeria phaeospora TaxID=100035 RepID=A0A7C8HZC3_9PLEO|nr:hypothetical protein BDV95DRAFT_599117 [Massariosphaeria phaeospora]